MNMTGRNAIAAIATFLALGLPGREGRAQEKGTGASLLGPSHHSSSDRRAKNVILFVGDGMGVSTIAATRVFSVGVGGQLTLDRFPYTAMSRTYSSDSITADSAPTMTAMVTGHNTNAGVLSLDETTEFLDFNGDGDGRRLPTVLEKAKARGLKVGVVSTARITHATPAACYSHINDRNNENAIALQALPGDPTYNPALGSGVDLLLGGGRQFFVPTTVKDEEGGNGSRTDGRDLRAEFQARGYKYVWNRTGLETLSQLPALGLFERSHMEYETDRATDQGGEPSLTEMTLKAIDLLGKGGRRNGRGFFLMVEGGRIDHAHHEGNAYRALNDARELDHAVAAALGAVDLDDTLVLVTADHSHVFNIAGYPMRPKNEVPYPIQSFDPAYANLAGNGILDVVYDINPTTGKVEPSTDANGTPYGVLVYGNGPGYRGLPRVDPRTDPFPGRGGLVPTGPWDPAYFQEAPVPMASETHAGEDVILYAAGAGAHRVRGTVKNTFVFEVMARALGLPF